MRDGVVDALLQRAGPVPGWEPLALVVLLWILGGSGTSEGQARGRTGHRWASLVSLNQGGGGFPLSVGGASSRMGRGRVLTSRSPSNQNSRTSSWDVADVAGASSAVAMSRTTPRDQFPEAPRRVRMLIVVCEIVAISETPDWRRAAGATLATRRSRFKYANCISRQTVKTKRSHLRAGGPECRDEDAAERRPAR